MLGRFEQRISAKPTEDAPRYVPAHFAEQRPEVLHALMQQHPLGMLVTHGAAGLDANHIPFEFDAKKGPNGTLRAHVARTNPVWQEAANNPNALVIFQGPTAYISPTWYPSKHETHRQVPTYNYMVVHAHGRIVVHDDETFVRGLVARLTRKMEAGEQTPWKMGDAPADFISQMLGAIVGIAVGGSVALLAIVVALDRSGSMAAPASGGRNKLDLANIGTVQVLDLLTPNDELGVIAVDSSPHEIVPIDTVEKNAKMRGKILSIDSMGGGIFIYEALSAAARMILSAHAENRHIILFAIGEDISNLVRQHPSVHVRLSPEASSGRVIEEEIYNLLR